MIDQFAKEMLSSFQAQADTLKGAKSFTEQQIKSMAESAMRNLNMVSREEFDIQQAILERANDKVRSLEKQLAELEAKLNTLS